MTKNMYSRLSYKNKNEMYCFSMQHLFSMEKKKTINDVRKMGQMFLYYDF